MKTIAIIPARGGSKGVPKKNLVELCGHPLVAWTIGAARQSKNVAQVFVSTDCREIAKVSEHYGAAVVMRPREISGDSASSESAIIHVLDELERTQGIVPELCVFLQATSPLREIGEIDRALEKFRLERLDSLLSVAQAEDQLLWSLKDGALTCVNHDYRHRKPRQDESGHEKLLCENGSIYIFRTQLLRETGNRLGGKIGVALAPYWRSFQIDTVEELTICRFLMRELGLDRQGLIEIDPI